MNEHTYTHTHPATQVHGHSDMQHTRVCMSLASYPSVPGLSPRLISLSEGEGAQRYTQYRCASVAGVGGTSQQGDSAPGIGG